MMDLTTMKLHYISTIQTDYGLIIINSGMILKELIHVIKELIKLNFINTSTKFHLVAMDLNYDNGLDNLVRYYDRIGFWIDSCLNSTDENTLSMMTTISHFIDVN